MYEEYVKAYRHHSAKYGADTAIFYMVGKFYEMYDWIDPVTQLPQSSMGRAAELLNLQLSRRSGAGPKGANGLFAGVPEQSLHKYAATLTRLNWTVVVYDQVKDAKGAVVERTPTRILSPGTHVEAAQPTGEAVWLGGVWLEEPAWGSQQPPKFALVAMDLTTGRLATFEGAAVGKDTAWSADDAFHFFQVHSPREAFVWWKGDQPSKPTDETVRRNFGLTTARLQTERAIPNGLDTPLVREEYLRQIVSVKSLLPLREALGIQGAPLTERALCALFQRVEEMYPSGVKAFHPPERWMPGSNLFLGNQALLQLNMAPSRGEQSILGLFERTVTPFGRRAIRSRLLYPSADPELLEERYRELEFFGEFPENSRNRLVELLRRMEDLPRLHRNLGAGELNSDRVEKLDRSYESVLKLCELLAGTTLGAGELAVNVAEALAEFSKIFSVDRAKCQTEDTFCFQAGVAPEVDRIEAELAKLNLKMERIVVDVSEWVGLGAGALRLEFRETLPPILTGGGKAAAVAIEAALKQGHHPFARMEFHKKKAGASLEVGELSGLFYARVAKREELARAIRTVLPALCERFVTRCGTALELMETWVAKIDVTYTIWRVGVDNGFVRPRLFAPAAPAAYVSVDGLRHPLIEKSMTRLEYVQHNVTLDGDANGWLVYGMNASGKSSLMKAVGIAVILAQAGCYVPATSFTFWPFRSLFTRILNTDNIWAGLSSFAVEMTELREVLHRADAWSLVLGDEVCSGTESVSATALVGASLKSLTTKNAKFIFATHLHGLQDIPGLATLPGLRTWHLKVRYDIAADKLIYERTLTPGAGSSLYGLEVAKAMNLPSDVLADAHAIRRGLLGTATEAEAPKSAWNSALQRRACELCGAQIVKDLEVHHIQPRAEAVGGRLTDGTAIHHARNLITLCAACHDKAHADAAVAPQPLRQTSAGPERLADTPDLTQYAYQPAMPRRSTRWTAEQQATIEQYLRKYPNCPPKRMIYDLAEKEGIQISIASLRTFRRTVDS